MDMYIQQKSSMIWLGPASGGTKARTKQFLANYFSRAIDTFTPTNDMHEKLT